ncbi:MAG TPA: hypothetical protein VFI31_06605 [Pirellulales bacterium]|nr:hypothetical protein [Pirellulales bacterium]
MGFVETLVYVAAGSPATFPVRSGCTSLMLCEDRELRPHPIVPPVVRCGHEKPRCSAEPVKGCSAQTGCRTSALAFC